MRAFLRKLVASFRPTLPPPQTLFTVGAALVVIGLLLTLAACGGGSDGGTPTSPPPASLVLTLSTQRDTAVVGETLSVSLSATRGANQALGLQPSWTSSAPSVLSVLSTSSGALALRAVGTGTATITATAEGVTASRTLTVLTPRYTDVTLDAPSSIYTNRTRTLHLTATDWRNRTVRLALTGITSSNPAVATVTSDSLFATTGTPGSTTLSIPLLSGETFKATITVTPPVVPITLIYPEGVSDATRAAFAAAARRWEDTFASGWPAVPVSVLANVCSPNTPAVQEAVAGIRVLVFDNHPEVVGTNAGVGGVCIVRNGRTVIGTAYLSPTVSFTDAYRYSTAVHELGHVIGIGFWDDSKLTDQAAKVYVGAEGVRQYKLLGGTANSVGLSSDGGHWSSTALPREVMNVDGPTSVISRVTLGALIDMGYPMRLSAADSYTSSVGMLTPSYSPRINSQMHAASPTQDGTLRLIP